MESPVKPGDVLAGKYRVERVLGAGAMGVVVPPARCSSASCRAQVHPAPGSAGGGTQDRFLREARAAGKLRGEHVARVMDFGTLETGAPYIVMEFLEGKNLEEVLEARGPLPEADAVRYLLDACKAMAEAHAAGIVHRDLKPQNLFLTARPDGSELVKVLDFGISKLVEPTEQSGVTSTQTGSMLGSPAYLAPEQVRSSKHVDARGRLRARRHLVQLVTGQRPFTSDSIGGCSPTCWGPSRRVRDVRPDASLSSTPSSLVASPRIRRSFPSVAALAEALNAPPPGARRSPDRRRCHGGARSLASEDILRISHAETMAAARPSQRAPATRATPGQGRVVDGRRRGRAGRAPQPNAVWLGAPRSLRAPWEALLALARGTTDAIAPVPSNAPRARASFRRRAPHPLDRSSGSGARKPRAARGAATTASTEPEAPDAAAASAEPEAPDAAAPLAARAADKPSRPAGRHTASPQPTKATPPSRPTATSADPFGSPD